MLQACVRSTLVVIGNNFVGGCMGIQLVGWGRGLFHKVRLNVVKQDLRCEEEPDEILDHDVRKLRTCETIIPSNSTFQILLYPYFSQYSLVDHSRMSDGPQTSGKNTERNDSSALGDSSLDSSLLNGLGVAFRHTNLDRLPRFDINIG
uniref:Uncharacterized protein n=1 Tax=Solanum tuberosum TaxID=4113 RepID=M1DAQ3_SOLTU